MHVDGEEDADNGGEDDELAEGLDVEGCISEARTLEHVCVVIVCAGDGAGGVGLGGGAKSRGVARKGRKGGGPEGEGGLISDDYSECTLDLGFLREAGKERTYGHEARGRGTKME